VARAPGIAAPAKPGSSVTPARAPGRRYGKSPEDFGLPNEPGRLKKVVGGPSGRRALAKCAEWLKEQAKEIQNLKECLECLHRD